MRVRTVGCLAVVLAMAAPLAGQSCSLMPSDENRLWAGGHYAAGAAAGLGGLELGMDLFGRVYVEGNYTFGGYDTGRGTATRRAASVGAPVRVAGLHLCPTAFVESTVFGFLDRFDADRGEVSDFRGGVRLPVAGPAVERAGVEFRWLAAVDVAWRRWERASRTVILDSGVSVDVENATDRDAVVEGLVGVRGRADGVGLTIGIANRLLDKRRFLPFIQVGVRIG